MAGGSGRRGAQAGRSRRWREQGGGSWVQRKQGGRSWRQRKQGGRSWRWREQGGRSWRSREPQGGCRVVGEQGAAAVGWSYRPHPLPGLEAQSDQEDLLHLLPKWGILSQSLPQGTPSSLPLPLVSPSLPLPPLPPLPTPQLLLHLHPLLLLRHSVLEVQNCNALHRSGCLV